MSTNGGDGAGAPRVVVLGGVPAVDVAALRAAQLGADSTLIERAELGGTCLNWGCIPTKSLLATADLLRRVRRADEYGLVVPEVSFDFSKMMERKDQIVLRQRQGVEGAAKRKGVKVVRGEGRVDGDAVVVDGDRHPFDHLVVCVGTEPSGLPGFDMEHPAILTSNDILVLEKVPESMLVVGGGVVGCEFASLFAPLGTKITVVEILPRLLLGIDNRTASQFQRLLEKDGVEVRLGRQVAEITEYRDDGVTVRLDDDTEVSAEKLLVSVGRRSASPRSSVATGRAATSRRMSTEPRSCAPPTPGSGAPATASAACSSPTWPRPRPRARSRTPSAGRWCPSTARSCRAASTPIPRSRPSG